MMADAFQILLGSMAPAEIDSRLRQKMKDLEPDMTGDDWLYMRGKQVPGRVVKVRSGVEVVNRVHKAVGGLIRADFINDGGKLKDISISGDFFCYPRDAVVQLAAELENTVMVEVPGVITGLIEREKIEMPGVTLDDWMQIFKT
jgi:lipoate-protein ligase A